MSIVLRKKLRLTHIARGDACSLEGPGVSFRHIRNDRSGAVTLT